jgi:hypothetical protein
LSAIVVAMDTTSLGAMKPLTSDALPMVAHSPPLNRAESTTTKENLLDLVKPETTEEITRPNEKSDSMDFTRSSNHSSRILANHSKQRGLLGLVSSRTWRKKLKVKNAEYPRVTSPGTYFISHSGGFQLYQQKTRDYLGHYTKSAIKELENRYGKKRK